MNVAHFFTWPITALFACSVFLETATGQSLSSMSFDRPTLQSTNPPPADTSPPTPPGNLQATNITSGKVVLTWSASTDDSGTVTYVVQRDRAVLQASVTNTTYTDFTVVPGTTYSYRVQAVDPAGNASTFSVPLTVTVPEAVLVDTHGLLLEVWTNIIGTSVSDLRNDPRFETNAPDFRTLATAADTRTVFEDNTEQNYGGRLTGWLIPADSGLYEFFIRSSANSELWLSPDESPANLVQIAREPNCCQPFQESGSEQTSAPITLIGGRRYAVQLLYKVGMGEGFAQIAWRKVGDTTLAAFLQPIPSEFLLTRWDPNQGPPILTTRPQSTTVFLGGTGTLTGIATIGDQPITYQWSLAGVDLPAETNTALTITNFAITNVGLYRITASNAVGHASALGGLFPKGAIYVEAEDFNFGHGQYITNEPIGMTGPYLGGAYRGLGTSEDFGVDWQAASGSTNSYRTNTAVNVDLENLQADWFPRGDFQVQVNNILTAAPGEWFNYTRAFPSPAVDYYVLARMAFSTNTVQIQLDDVTGATTTNQLLTGLGEFRPGRATSSTNTYEFFPLVDGTGAPVILTNWSGERTFRVTLGPETANLDYLLFAPLISDNGIPGSFTSVTRVGNNLILTWENGILESADSPAGPWAPVPNATSPFTAPLTGPQKFYRVRQSTTPPPPTGTGFSSITRSGNNLVLSWTNGILESADSPLGQWTPVPNATSPFTIPMDQPHKFYRIQPGGTPPPPTTNGFTSVTRNGNNLVLVWTTGTLESAHDLVGTWTPVAGATSPFTVPLSESQLFFRIR